MGDFYDVFISHCGKDTKRGFAVWLKTELQRVGLQCFFDESSLRGGDWAPDKMLAAMENAGYGIVVLSPGFFSQEWCMLELLTFVRRGNIFPVFYPSYEEVDKARKEALQKEVWQTFNEFVKSRQEYEEAANARFTGLRLDSFDGFQNVCIRAVRDSILKLLDKSVGGLRLTEDDLLVGQQEHLLKLKELLGIPKDMAKNAPSKADSQQPLGRPSRIAEGSGSSCAVGSESQEVGIVGVNGMGGIGKSTLARMLYDDPDVREWFGKNLSWLKVGQQPSDEKICKLQGELLKQLCDVDVSCSEPAMGRALIRKRLSGKKVIIFLDDMWGDAKSEEQVVRVQDLGPGSRIIKTTRNAEAIGGLPYPLDVLDPEPALELLSWLAFKGKKPPKELVDLAHRALERCSGLPLAIRLLASEVFEADRLDDKRKCLQRFVNLPLGHNARIDCQSVIRSSFDNLPSAPEGLKDAFILIAGHWPDNEEFREKRRAIQNLGAAVYGEYPVGQRQAMAEVALEKLANRSLIKLEDKASDLLPSRELILVSVHDLLVDVAVSQMKEGRLAKERKFFRLIPEQENLGPLSDPNWLHVVVATGNSRWAPPPCLTSPNSRLSSLVVTYTPKGSTSDNVAEAIWPEISDYETLGPSPCRLLSLVGMRVRLQQWQYVQCLRLRVCRPACRRDEWLEAIKGMMNLNILEVTQSSAHGMLPAKWAVLTGLQLMDLSSNRLNGALPAEWAALTGLQSIALSQNQLSGVMPADWAALTGLKAMDLSSNELSGALPAEWAAFTELRAMYLSKNQLSGALPVQWAALTGLRVMELSTNQLSGALPTEWAALTGLQSVGLSENQLSGALPKEWASLTGLQSMSLYRNQLSGALPAEWAALTGLQWTVGLSWNQLSGELPAEWAALTGLRSMELSGNKLMGALPTEWAALTGLQLLDLSWNELNGALPTKWAALTGLQAIDLRENKLSGALPTKWAALTGLEEIDLSSNELTGELPTEWAALTGLRNINLSTNKLSWELPMEWAALSRLEVGPFYSGPEVDPCGSFGRIISEDSDIEKWEEDIEEEEDEQCEGEEWGGEDAQLTTRGRVGSLEDLVLLGARLGGPEMIEADALAAEEIGEGGTIEALGAVPVPPPTLQPPYMERDRAVKRAMPEKRISRVWSIVLQNMPRLLIMGVATAGIVLVQSRTHVLRMRARGAPVQASSKCSREAAGGREGSPGT